MQDDNKSVECASKLAALQETYRVPGVGVVWISAGSISRSFGQGTAVAGSDREVSDRTVFQAASLSKPVFALAVLQLAARGGFDLDVPLSTHGMTPPLDDPRLAPVTARVVLRHSTGLPNWIRGENLEMLCAPDCRFTYSGAGYVAWTGSGAATSPDGCCVPPDRLRLPNERQRVFRVRNRAAHTPTVARQAASIGDE